MTIPQDASPSHEQGQNMYPARLRGAMELDGALDTTPLTLGLPVVFDPNKASLSDTPCSDADTGTYQTLSAVVSPTHSDKIFGLVKVVDLRPEQHNSALTLVDLSDRNTAGKPVVGVLTPDGDAIQLGTNLEVRQTGDGQVVVVDQGSAGGAELFTRKVVSERASLPGTGNIVLGGLRRRLGRSPTRVLERVAGAPYNDLTENVKRWAIDPQSARAVMDRAEA
jgi:hypothetical protein